MNAYASVPAAYKESSIMTATPERLVVMLYDGAHRFLTQAAVAMRANDLAQSNDRLQRAEAIISELNVTLDMSAGEIADRLRAIYLFSRRHLTEARLERDPQKIETVSRMLGELRESWAQIAGE
ncbi:MAG TPA: flagellar export chaperone FliS [Gaiellaceae bacterium]|nr:flagellar export chaperone FliS [Gaiellaceae bacterium]